MENANMIIINLVNNLRVCTRILWYRNFVYAKWPNITNFPEVNITGLICGFIYVSLNWRNNNIIYSNNCTYILFFNPFTYYKLIS